MTLPKNGRAKPKPPELPRKKARLAPTLTVQTAVVFDDGKTLSPGPVWPPAPVPIEQFVGCPYYDKLLADLAAAAPELELMANTTGHDNTAVDAK